MKYSMENGKSEHDADMKTCQVKIKMKTGLLYYIF